MGEEVSITRHLCQKNLSARPSANEAAMHEAKRGALDYLASAFAGRRDTGVALALLGQPCGLEQFAQAPISPETIELMKRMERSYDPIHHPIYHPSADAVPKGRFTIVAITMQDGTVHSQEIAAPKGSPGNHLSDGELEMKFRDAIGQKELAEELLALIHSLETTTVDKLMDLL